jgi:hypothetical protein
MIMKRFIECEDRGGRKFRLNFDAKISKRNFLNVIDEYDYAVENLKHRIKRARLSYKVNGVNKSFGYTNVE